MVDWNQSESITNLTGGSAYNATSQTPESAIPVDHSGGVTGGAAGNVVAESTVLRNVPPRVNQQRVLPNAIKGRLMQPVQDDGGVVLNTSIAVPDGLSTIVFLTTTSTNGGMILGQPYWQVFIDNFIPSQAMPQSVSSNSYPFYAWNSLYDELGEGIVSQPGKTVSALQVRNAIGDGSTRMIYIQVYVRMIINGSGNTTSG